MKKAILIFALTLLPFSYAACAFLGGNTPQVCCDCCKDGNTCMCNTEEITKTPIVTEDGIVLEEKTFFPTAEYVRPIGRAQELDSTLWLTWSGTGMEFEFTGTSAKIKVIADNNYGAKDNQTRLAIYVNGEQVIEDMVDQKEEIYDVYESTTPETCVIKVVKLSESLVSTVGISAIEVVCNEDIKPTEASGKLIEFIGDSLTTGYGLDDPHATHHYSPKTQNVTKTYAYKAAEQLGADYSMIAISGYGVITGSTSDGNKKEQNIVPLFYDRLGATYGIYLEKYSAQELFWDFEKAQPDLIVINLGSNDNTYAVGDDAKKKEFAVGYLEFIKAVRENNPNATILCTLGMIKEDLFPSIEYAVEWYKMETGDTNIYTMEYDEMTVFDGFVADWHPSEKVHDKAAEKLTAKIKEIMGW